MLRRGWTLGRPGRARPRTVEVADMRQVRLEVGNKKIGTALTWAYPEGKAHGLFWIPTYNLEVSGTDASGGKVSRSFEVFRFGVHCPTKSSSPTVVGLAKYQVHVIKAWLPHYSVHSAPSVEQGAWQVYGNFLIHDGPDDPKKEVYASIGCIEICNGPAGFDAFNDYLISLSGPTSSSRKAQLAEIGRARNLTITYLAATRPALKPY
jgi:hypothetical protein